MGFEYLSDIMLQHSCGDLTTRLRCGIVSSMKAIVSSYKMVTPRLDRPLELHHVTNTNLDKNGLGQEPSILNHHASGTTPLHLFRPTSVSIALKLAWKVLVTNGIACFAQTVVQYARNVMHLMKRAEEVASTGLAMPTTIALIKDA